MAAPSQLGGQILGHYRILEQIGAGGMGVVYRAHDERLDRDVALKVLTPGALVDEAARKRFRKEALALSRLNHPNIAMVFDFDTQDDMDFLVIEYIPGTTLDASVGPDVLPEKQVIRLGLQLAEGLTAAHEQRVVHRDLKPSNLRITPDCRLKILDFGIAKLLPTSERQATETLTEAQGVTGTLPYMAPEQLQGEQPDSRTDIYAAGTVLYEMATGRRPFEQRLSTALADDIIHKPPAPPRQVNRKLSSKLEDLILKCLEKEPDNRYQSARELAIDLRRLTYPSQPSLGVRPGPKRKRAVFTLVGALLALAVVFSLSRWIYLRKATVSLPQYEQLTNFSQSADSPALSPDGRMLAFTLGPDKREIYVKPLPSGEPVLIAKDAFEKSSLTFSPDGSRIAYTVEAPLSWDTWVVPLLGGQPRRMLPNASALTWIDDHRVLFSEVKKGIHMGIVTATESRTETRDVYVPPTETGMAHESFISPEHKWVLISGMDATGLLPCRIVPFDGSSSGHQVGPKGPCVNAGWSPDGKWMYFSANLEGSYHIWRQRFPNGEPEQVTFGATEEDNFTLAPDGRSIVTTVKVEQSSIWLHDAAGEREISAEGFATLVSFSSDGKKLYYLVRSGPQRAHLIGELWAVELASGRRERILPDFSVTHYNVSRDGRTVVFSALDAAGKSGIWLASLDRRFTPRQITSSNEYWPSFGRPGEILFVGEEGKSKFLYRMKEDGTERQKTMQDEVLYLVSISPDGDWAVAWVPVPGQGGSSAVFAYPTRGGVPIRICDVCTSVWSERAAATVAWSPDGKFFYVSLQYFPGINQGKTFVIPLRQGVPPLPKQGIKSERDLTSLPGVRVIGEKDVFAGPNPSAYAFRRLAYSSNIYRVRLQ
jgi:serine/threonine protein kinase